jgi:HEAT repeat protein
MNKRLVIMWTAISCLAAAAHAEAQERVGNWVETRFHRVHLLNGNFVDGQLVQDSPKTVVLKIAGVGEMSIRKDFVKRDAKGALRIEFVKMRSYQEPVKIEPVIDQGQPSQAAQNVSSTPTSPTTPAIATEAVTLTGSVAEQLTQAREILKNATPARKKGAVEALLSLGAEAAPLLAEVLGSLDDDSLLSASNALQQMKEASVLPTIRSLLSSDRAIVREQAVSLLGLLGTASEEAGKVRGMLRDSAIQVRVAALVSVGRLVDVEAFDLVADLLSDPNPMLRTRAISVLIDLGEKGGLSVKVGETLGRHLEQSEGETLLDFLKEASKLNLKELGPAFARLATHTEPMVRSYAIAGIGKIASPEHADLILERMTIEREYWPRIALAGTVQAMRLDKAIDPLIEWLSDSDANICAAALRSLRGMTRLNFVDQEAWKEWREKTRR